MVRSCIFDLDGTLLNTLGDITSAVNATLNKFGFPEITEKQCGTYIGSGTRVLLQRAAQKPVSDEMFKKMYDEYMVDYRNNLIGKTVPYDGILNLVSLLFDSGVKLSVCSNKPDDCAKFLTDRFFRNKFFKVCGQKENIPVKPDPHFPLEIISESGISPEDTVMIGDSAQDVLTGKNAGIKTLSVLWGYQSREKIEAAGGNIFFEKAEELGKFILNGN